MRNVFTAALSAALIAAPVFAGALTLQVDDARANPDAIARRAVVAVHITACTSPEKTMVTATAEGFAKGKRTTIPLSVARLSAPGAFAVSREWPEEGLWVVKLVATNPEYRDYATSIVVPIRGDDAVLKATKVFYHAPSANEVDAVLNQTALN